MLSRLSVVLFLTLTSPALADGHLALKCDDLDIANPDDVRTSFLCLADYQQRLQLLEQKVSKLIDANNGEPVVKKTHTHDYSAAQHNHDLSTGTGLLLVPSIGNHVDTRAVIAYTSAKGERACPAGWSPYEKAKNRVILGAGDLYRVVEGTGGRAVVELEKKHMPAHTHRISTGEKKVGDPSRWHTGLAGSTGNVINSGIDQLFNPTKKTGGLGPLNTVLESQGQGIAHENMPPWISLYYCVKDKR